jgi:hypothetical protein
MAAEPEPFAYTDMEVIPPVWVAVYLLQIMRPEDPTSPPIALLPKTPAETAWASCVEVSGDGIGGGLA